MPCMTCPVFNGRGAIEKQGLCKGHNNFQHLQQFDYKINKRCTYCNFMRNVCYTFLFCMCKTSDSVFFLFVIDNTDSTFLRPHVCGNYHPLALDIGNKQR